jgi:hypothetical protein
MASMTITWQGAVLMKEPTNETKLYCSWTTTVRDIMSIPLLTVVGFTHKYFKRVICCWSICLQYIQHQSATSSECYLLRNIRNNLRMIVLLSSPIELRSLMVPVQQTVPIVNEATINPISWLSSSWLNLLRTSTIYSDSLEHFSRLKNCTMMSYVNISHTSWTCWAHTLVLAALTSSSLRSATVYMSVFATNMYCCSTWIVETVAGSMGDSLCCSKS